MAMVNHARDKENQQSNRWPITAKKIVPYLRYGSASQRDSLRIWHSIHTIQRLTGLNRNQILTVLGEEHLKRRGLRIRRKVFSQPYSSEQVRYITSTTTLEEWKTLTIDERVERLKARYPNQKHTAYRLRQLYQSHKIKLRPIGLEILKTEKQLAEIQNRKLDVFPHVINLIQTGQTVIFLDEAMFTIGQTRASTWMATKQKICVAKKKAGYQAIAVVSCIDQNGKVQAIHMADKAINLEEFMVFLYRLFFKYRHEEVTLYMDNLSLHRALMVRDYVEDRDGQIVFGPPYSSEFNPVERLWAFAKKTFRKQCMLRGDYSNLEEIKGLVHSSIIQAPQESLRKKVQSCVEHMQRELIQLGYNEQQSQVRPRSERYIRNKSRKALQQQKN